MKALLLVALLQKHTQISWNSGKWLRWTVWFSRVRRGWCWRYKTWPGNLIHFSSASVPIPAGEHRASSQLGSFGYKRLISFPLALFMALFCSIANNKQDRRVPRLSQGSTKKKKKDTFTAAAANSPGLSLNPLCINCSFSFYLLVICECVIQSCLSRLISLSLGKLWRPFHKEEGRWVSWKAIRYRTHAAHRQPRAY